MDAVKRCWHVFRALVFMRPLVFVLLSLFYLLPAFLTALGTSKPESFGFALAMILMIPTAGIFALASERIEIVCVSAGELKLPRHSVSVRLAQLAMMVVFIGIPVLFLALISETDRLVLAAIMVVAAALGTAFVTQRFVLIGLVVAALVTPRDVLWQLALNPYLQGAAVVGALYLLYRWSLLAARIDEQAGQRVITLADAAHEETDASLSETFGVHPDDVDQYERALSANVAHAKRRDTAEPVVATLEVGLGFEARTNLKALQIGIGSGLLIVLAWHFLHGHRPRVIGFGIVTAFATVTLLGRIASIYERWRATSIEQSLLKLSPRWPGEWAVKRLFLRCIGSAQLGSWIGWAVVALLALPLGSISVEELVSAAVVLLAASCGSAGSMFLLMSRGSLNKWHASTILVTLCAVAGAVMFVVSTSTGESSSSVALVLILAPAVIGLATLLLRPLQFPVVLVDR